MFCEIHHFLPRKLSYPESIRFAPGFTLLDVCKIQIKINPLGL
ncbi:hypothetical protein LEP1GSC192_0094 [Leptospira sp. B5-022]|nr:hypothetical protein LEP1GSC192_0094 [Leptospira sp. B5-022]